MEQTDQVFSYIAPGQEEQKSFWYQVVGSLLALLVLIALAVWRREGGPAALMLGAGLAIVFRLVQAAREMERRGQRARHAQFGLEAQGLRVTTANQHTFFLAWDKISKAEVRGGRLHLEWAEGSLSFGSREVHDGMRLTQEIVRRLPGQQGPSLFIPLTPK